MAFFRCAASQASRHSAVLFPAFLPSVIAWCRAYTSVKHALTPCPRSGGPMWTASPINKAPPVPLETWSRVMYWTCSSSTGPEAAGQAHRVTKSSSRKRQPLAAKGMMRTGMQDSSNYVVCVSALVINVVCVLACFCVCVCEEQQRKGGGALPGPLETRYHCA